MFKDLKDCKRKKERRKQKKKGKKKKKEHRFNTAKYKNPVDVARGEHDLVRG